MLRLEDLKFREETREGGTVIEYLVEGRKKTQAVPRMVGEVLEAVVSEVLEMKTKWADFNRIAEAERERLASTSGRDGNGTAGRVGGPDKGKEKAKANTKARARKGA